MQYIRKNHTPPIEWNEWFTTKEGNRSFDYKEDYNKLRYLKNARKFLLDEQKGLCAYCQSRLTLENSSIEHIIPKTFNQELSTNYHNLVAVCRQPVVDESGRSHCDKERGNSILTPLILHTSMATSLKRNHAYFKATASGELLPNENLDEATKVQVKSFIEVLNLNHTSLKTARKNRLDALLVVTRAKGIKGAELKLFWDQTFNYYYQRENEPYRQFLLIYLSTKLGRN